MTAAAASQASPRAIVKVIEGMPASDGAGVRLNRVIGQPALDTHDPFLLLDEFKSDQAEDYIAGFPDHPHRGFETVTYMLAGSMRHADNKGHSGVISAGGVQWMTAGSGIVHSEMPEQDDGLMWGFQLWINLPAAEKMQPAAYQEYDRSEIPEETRDGGVFVRVIAGRTSQQTTGPVGGVTTAPLYFDISMPPAATFEEPIDATVNGFLYVFEGSVAVDGPDDVVKVGAGELGVLGAGTVVRLRTDEQPARLLLLAARPINEPIARYGPLVMNTREEIMQAFQDMQAGRL
jgi:redox-sensitive bicupin YhaK (pirin superfamily)